MRFKRSHAFAAYSQPYSSALLNLILYELLQS